MPSQLHKPLGRPYANGSVASHWSTTRIAVFKADSTGRRNTFDHGGVYGTTCRVDAEVDGARGNALTR
ncbi:hypothetical protein, partial [Pseudomonas aeruginosa]|uniref:hypothetical protein n=1 Tax=Pseudomonas aeruginosa TaxID=287 RepID=UPI0027388F10